MYPKFHPWHRHFLTLIALCLLYSGAHAQTEKPSAELALSPNVRVAKLHLEFAVANLVEDDQSAALLNNAIRELDLVRLLDSPEKRIGFTASLINGSWETYLSGLRFENPAITLDILGDPLTIHKIQKDLEVIYAGTTANAQQLAEIQETPILDDSYTLGEIFSDLVRSGSYKSTIALLRKIIPVRQALDSIEWGVRRGDLENPSIREIDSLEAKEYQGQTNIEQKWSDHADANWETSITLKSSALVEAIVAVYYPEKAAAAGLPSVDEIATEHPGLINTLTGKLHADISFSDDFERRLLVGSDHSALTETEIHADPRLSTFFMLTQDRREPARFMRRLQTLSADQLTDFLKNPNLNDEIAAVLWCYIDANMHSTNLAKMIELTQLETEIWLKKCEVSQRCEDPIDPVEIDFQNAIVRITATNEAVPTSLEMELSRRGSLTNTDTDWFMRMGSTMAYLYLARRALSDSQTIQTGIAKAVSLALETSIAKLFIASRSTEYHLTQLRDIPDEELIDLTAGEFAVKFAQFLVPQIRAVDPKGNLDHFNQVVRKSETLFAIEDR